MIFNQSYNETDKIFKINYTIIAMVIKKQTQREKI